MANMSKDVGERLSFALEIAQEAGDITLRYFRRQDLVVDSKADSSPVTIADRSAEELLRERLGQRFPVDGIIGEEFGTSRGTSGFDWTLDPIDGTKSFIHGVPLYTTLLSVLHDGRPVLGVIHAPALCETVYAGHGGGCWYLGARGAKPQAAKVSRVKQLSDGLFVTTEIEGFHKNERGADALDIYLRLQRAARVSRTWGDGYGYLMVATGRAEAMMDPIVNLWDVAPLPPIIEEAGGKFSDWSGELRHDAGEAIATNGLVHDEVLGVIRGD